MAWPHVGLVDLSRPTGPVLCTFFMRWLSSYGLASYEALWPLPAHWPCVLSPPEQCPELDLGGALFAASIPIVWIPVASPDWTCGSHTLVAVWIPLAWIVTYGLNPYGFRLPPLLDLGAARFGGRLDRYGLDPYVLCPYGFPPTGPGVRTFSIAAWIPVAWICMSWIAKASP